MKKVKKILLVDDDTIANFYNQLIIKEMDITDAIVVKHNGAEALSFLQEIFLNEDTLQNDQCPEIMFLDVNMPVMNGLELLAALHRLNKAIVTTHVRIVILSSSNHPHDVDTAHSLGVRTFLTKPLTEEKITGVLSGA